MKVATYTTFCIVFLSANMSSGTDIFTSFSTNSLIEVRIKLGEVIITTSRVGERAFSAIRLADKEPIRG